FPSSNHFAAIMSTLAVFASGFITRPIGALIFGHLGDTLGRKYTLLATIFLMALATFCIGLIPVGTGFSTIALVVCRLVQGLATSGEYPGGIALLAEQNGKKHQGFVTSFAIFGTGAGCLAGAIVFAVIMKCLGHDQMLAWGWRLPFLLAGPLGIIGILVRRSVFESQEFIDSKAQGKLSKKPILLLFKQYKKNLAAALGISIFTNAVIYINLLYLSSYSLSIHRITAAQSANIYLLVTFAYTMSILLFGFLSDYIGKKKIIATAFVLTLILTYPLFHLTFTGSIVMQFITQGIFSMIVGMVLGPFASLIAESFPTAVRFTGMSFALNVAASFFGGTAPIFCGWLTTVFHTPVAPAFYIIVLAAVALLAVIKIRAAQEAS
ncbi:MAG: MFS transporter, partial [Gammaproteobacteria bacterium]|nr:MFS transporter [Gammaproteobacteria bacterium]